MVEMKQVIVSTMVSVFWIDLQTRVLLSSENQTIPEY